MWKFFVGKAIEVVFGDEPIEPGAWADPIYDWLDDNQPGTGITGQIYKAKEGIGKVLLHSVEITNEFRAVEFSVTFHDLILKQVAPTGVTKGTDVR